MDPAKLKVVELRAELSKRGLDTKGNKPVLVERLKEALEKEQAGGAATGSVEQAKTTQSASEKESESEDDGGNQEPAKLPPRTPSRSSRHTSREPVTPVRTPTRRSSSRSSLSRQSPARTTLAESTNESAPVLEPIVEEEKMSPKKEAAPAQVVPPKKEAAPAQVVTPKKEAAPAQVVSPKKEAAPTQVVSPKKESAPALVASPKKEVAPTQVVSPKKEAAPVQVVSPKKEIAPAVVSQKEEVTPKKESTLQQESPKVNIDDRLETVKPAEQHVLEKSQEITRKPNIQSPTKSVTPQQSPAKPATQSPTKPAEVQSPAELVTASPVKSASTSPVKSVQQSPAQSVVESSPKSAVESPAKSAVESPAKPPIEQQSKPSLTSIDSKSSESPVKAVLAAQSPVKSAESPVKTLPAAATAQSPAKAGSAVPESPANEAPTAQSPAKPVSQNPVKAASPQKVHQSPVKKDESESPSKRPKLDIVEKKDDDSKNDDEGSKKEEESEAMEVDQQNDAKKETDEQESKSEKSEDRKRKRSPSPREEAPRAPPIARPENEPTINESDLLLSWYDSDLHVVINPIDYFSASPMQGDGFNFMWAGVRASHGFNKGKVFFEARVTNEFDNMAGAANKNVDTAGAIPADDEKIPSVLRVGWSTMGTSLQLGEEKFSYGYEGTGKKSTNNEFVEYGKTFGKDDVVGCYVDFETDGNVTLTYTVNGESQGPAFVVQKNELEGKALFPHLLGKSCSFQVNFGQEDPWNSNVLDGYTLVAKVDPSERVVGARKPEKREDCEVILLCGLPLSGKTSWAVKHAAENPEKRYNIMGTHTLIEKMKVEGVPLKDKFRGKWDVLVEKISRALNKLLESAPSRRRNYILDQQVNIYGSAQKRKMRNFYGFHRKAVVLIPSDEEFKARLAKRKEAAEGDEIREDSILEVKANMAAPTVGESFEEVIWPELNEEEGKKLIETYISEGKAAGHGQSQHQPNKRSRYDNGQKNRDNRDHRRNFNDRRSSGGAWRGGGSRWGDNNRMRGSPMRHGGGYGGGPPGAWRGRPMQPRGGGDRNDRRGGGGNDRNRQRQSGGWNAVGYQGNQSGTWGGGQGNWQAGWGSGGGAWNQQQAWGGAGNWKGYGANSYQSAAGGYGNGAASGTAAASAGNNWNNYGSQYYNQYWGQQQQQQQQQTGGQQSSTQATPASGGGQADTTATTPTANTAAADAYSQASWQQGYSTH